MFTKSLKINLIGCFILLTIGGLFLVGAGILYFYGRAKLTEEIIKGLAIKNESSFYVRKTINLRSYYFYEVLNADDLIAGVSSVPLVSERGPYVFENKPEKRNVSFSDDLKTVTYSPISFIYFRPDLSVGSLNDSLIFLNLPLAAIVDKLQSGELKLDPFYLSFLNFGLLNQKTQVFINLTIYDLVYGYSDSLIETIDQYQPGLLQNHKLNLLTAKNGTLTQNFTILTGKDDVNKVGSIVSWNNMSKLTFWDSDFANRIKGTDGSMFGPFKTKYDTLSIFNSDICRSVEMEYFREGQLNGVNTIEYHLPKNTFYNVTLNPDNEGFFKQNYIGNGLFDMRKCIGFPVILSQPHFLNADETFINSVNGISKPDPELHDIILKIYPLLGITLAAKIRVQFNFKLQKSSMIDLYSNISNVLLPTIWIEDNIAPNEQSKEQIGQLNQIVDLIRIFPLVLLIVGLFLILIGFILLFLYIGLSLKKN